VEPANFDLLPDEIIAKIFEDLDPEDLESLKHVSRRIGAIAQDDKVLGKAVATPLKQASPERADIILRAAPNIGNKDFIIKMIQSVKNDINHFEIQTEKGELASKEGMQNLEKKIRFASLKSFITILDDEGFIDLSENEINDEYLSNLDNFRNIHEIDLNDKKELRYIPSEIGNFGDLSYLNFSDCSVKYLPESISRLKELVVLNTTSNQLESLPDSFGKLQSLKDLYLQKNSITELPQTFGKLENLEELDLSENPLSRLPENFGNLKKLKLLGLSKDLKLDSDSEKILKQMQKDNPELKIVRTTPTENAKKRE
jgi:Leucine-rich repeat (LRR) protein